MTDTKRPWRFYGRQESKRLLKQALGLATKPYEQGFSMVRVRGRRWVGKTQLVKEIQNDAPTDWPFIYYEVPDKQKREFRHYSLEKVIEDLLKLAELAGFPEISDRLTLPVEHPHYTDWSKCEDLLLNLMRKGVILVLDEFDHAVPLELTIPVKRAVDVINKEHGQGYAGQMVVMGSHQQKFDDLFASDAPFYGRDSSVISLEQWSLRTVLEMATDQGILTRPDQFLTLWTAYGGMPSHWKRYCTGKTYAHLRTVENIDVWRRNFLEIEEYNLWSSKYERFDDRAYVELKPEHSELLLWIAQNHLKKGVKVKDIAIEGTFGNEKDINEKMVFFQNKLKLMDMVRPFDRKDFGKWQISDNNTLFQLNVFRELFENLNRETQTDLDKIIREPSFKETPILRLETLEGAALERLTAKYYEAMGDTRWVRSSVEQGGFDGDIDIMAIMFVDGQGVLYLVDAKRNAEKYVTEYRDKTMEVKTRQDNFMNALPDNDTMKTLRQMERKRVLVSTHFDAKKRKAIEKGGDFNTLDIPEMAREYGFDPGPVLVLKGTSDDEPEVDNEPDELTSPRPRMGM